MYRAHCAVIFAIAQLSCFVGQWWIPMGKLQNFTIEFDSPDGVYHAGQSVMGAVYIQLSDPTNVNGK